MIVSRDATSGQLSAQYWVGQQEVSAVSVAFHNCYDMAETPNTGDFSNIPAVWMLLSVCALAVLVLNRKRFLENQ